jgi:hypothetical protein
MYIGTQDAAVRMPFAPGVGWYENSSGRLCPRPGNCSSRCRAAGIASRANPTTDPVNIIDAPTA